ncbi:MAG: transporter substrate-binding domain-containing protein [Deltaproteobacteria bacterium]
MQRLILLVLFGLCFSSLGIARDLEGIKHSGQLIVCANKRAMPISGNEEPPGFQMEIAREIAKELNVRLVVEWIWASYQTKYTDCDMLLGVPRDPKPGGFMRYLQSLSDVEIILVFAGESREVTLDELPGKVIAVPSSSLAHFKLIEIGADPRVAYRSEESILEAIANEKLYAGVVSNVALHWYQNKHPELKFFSLSTDILSVYSHYPLTIGLRKMDSLGESDFQEIVEKMRIDGRLEQILASYGQSLSNVFDDPYASVPEEISEPETVSVRRDIQKELEEKVRKNRPLKQKAPMYE